MTDVATHKAWWQTRRAELIAEIQCIERQLHNEPPKDWEDRATERQGDEVLEAMEARDTSELRQIDAALARVDAGDYGYCVKCGAEISAKRLDALPATPFCLECATRT